LFLALLVYFLADAAIYFAKASGSLWQRRCCLGTQLGDHHLVGLQGAHDYPESPNMATSLHPQTIVATKCASEPIADPSDSRCPAHRDQLRPRNPSLLVFAHLDGGLRDGAWLSTSFTHRPPPTHPTKTLMGRAFHLLTQELPDPHAQVGKRRHFDHVLARLALPLFRLAHRTDLDDLRHAARIAGKHHDAVG
jgi:hypothetical protein